MAIVVRRAFPRRLLPKDLAGVAIEAITLKVCLRFAPMLSGCTKSLLSIRCFAALLPGTSAPSTAVVRKSWLPQTIGDECPRPSIGVFHLMFWSGLHSDGRFFSFEIPEPSGPRHCGQFPADAFRRESATGADKRDETTTVRCGVIVSLFLFL